MELSDDFDHRVRHSEAGEHFSEQVTIDGVVRFLQVDESQEQWDPSLPPDLLQQAHDQQRLDCPYLGVKAVLLLGKYVLCLAVVATPSKQQP